MKETPVNPEPSNRPDPEISSDVVCSGAGKSGFSGHQMVCRSSQAVVLSLEGSHGSRSLFSGVCQHRIGQQCLTGKVEQNLVYWKRHLQKKVQVATCDAQGLCLPVIHGEKTEAWLFLKKQLGLFSVEACLLSMVG